jgi:hypothetical protein
MMAILLPSRSMSILPLFALTNQDILDDEMNKLYQSPGNQLWDLMIAPVASRVTAKEARPQANGSFGCSV